MKEITKKQINKILPKKAIIAYNPTEDEEEVISEVYDMYQPTSKKLVSLEVDEFDYHVYWDEDNDPNRISHFDTGIPQQLLSDMPLVVFGHDFDESILSDTSVVQDMDVYIITTEEVFLDPDWHIEYLFQGESFQILHATVGSAGIPKKYIFTDEEEAADYLYENDIWGSENNDEEDEEY